MDNRRSTMQPDKHPIDEVFRKKLKHYQVPPPAGAWERIRRGAAGGKQPFTSGKKHWIWALLLMGSLMLGGYYAFKGEHATALPTDSMAMGTEQESLLNTSGKSSAAGSEVKAAEESKVSGLVPLAEENTGQTKRAAETKQQAEATPKANPIRKEVPQQPQQALPETDKEAGNSPEEPMQQTTAAPDRYERPPARVRVQVSISPEREQQATSNAKPEGHKKMGTRIIWNKQKVEKVLNQVLYLKKDIGQ
ncbi:prolipoprotein diacylglyceryl transferase [Thermonema rossianum]|uniref:hypothetical protein n=1 Tax=Thermonema rossianum TaxID=55505 RepID=UPI00146FA22C|nr:hypothetical protein [Thermonema rossianum]